MRLTVSRLSSLVSTSWVREHVLGSNFLRTSNLRILDASCNRNPEVDGYKEYYAPHHIPQASYFNLHKLCPKSKSSLDKFPVPDANRFQDYVESLGISSDTHVVAYDCFETVFALKTWWLFRLFGHDNVSVLDGGFTKWLRDGYEVSSDEPQFTRGCFKPDYRPWLLTSYEEMVQNVENGDKQLVDTRPATSFYNITEKMPEGMKGGHLPGSKNLPYPLFFNEDGTFKSTNELEELFAKERVDLNEPMVSTCQLGLTANALAMAALMLGKKDVPIYNGSFLEWHQRASPDMVIKE